MINYKRIISMILVVSMIMANNTVCFADSSVENSIDKIITVQDIADDIEDVTGTNDICNDISYDNDGLVADGEEVLVDIPNDGSEAISVNDGEGATYEMKLVMFL